MNQIDDLLSKLTLEEKIGQLTMLTAGAAVTGPGGVNDLQSAVRAGRVGSILNLWGQDETQRMQRIAERESRHGIPLFFGLDVIHGFKTIFPIPLGEAAAFNDDLWERTAQEAASEAAEAGIHLTFAPMIDVTRDPRWGRIAEGPGEDPVLGARFARAKVRGFQGALLSAPGAIAATAKHMAGYGAPMAGREYASVDISQRALLETYLPPFRAAVEEGTAAIMPAFNDIAGTPMSASTAILRDLVRGRWGFDGVYISDYNAITELIKHGVAGDLADAARLALKAGMDIDMMGFAYERGLPIAIEREPELMADVNAAVRRVLALKQKLGLLDGVRKPLTPTREAVARRRSLARDSACRSIVLLTNRGALPLDASLRRIAVLGPLAAASREMVGPWAAAGMFDGGTSILDGLKSALSACTVDHAPGCAIEGDDTAGIAEAVGLAHGSDLVVLCIGEAAMMSGEASSRSNTGLPGRQPELARAVMETGKPVVVVLSSGRPLTESWLFDRAQAVLSTWFLGTEAGTAIADVLTGMANPSARLPITWPRSVGQIPIYHSERPSGRPAEPSDRFTSKYLDTPNEPQFVFGHGLSYTRFACSNLRVPQGRLWLGATVAISVEVRNEGDRAGEETVLVFVHDVVASIARPKLAFKASAKVALEPGQTKTAGITLPAEAFAFVGHNLEPVTEPGEFDIFVGPKADRSQLLSARVTLAATV
jgi:beta-glucosidase